MQHNIKVKNLISTQIEYRLFHDDLLNRNVLHTSSRDTLYRMISSPMFSDISSKGPIIVQDIVPTKNCIEMLL